MGSNTNARIKMKLEQIKLSKLLLNSGQLPGVPKNPRFIKDDRYAKLLQSIKDDPEMLELRELIAVEHDGKYVVIAGNMRLRALRELGFAETPVKVLPADTDAKKLRAYATKDNVPFGAWDWEVAANEWDAEELEEWGVEMPDDWGHEDEVEAAEDDYSEPDDLQVDVVLGDLIEIGQHRLLCGDSTDSDEVARLMQGKKADMVFTDPPHDIEQVDFISYLDSFATGVKFILHNDKFLSSLAHHYKERFERFFVHDFIFHIGGGNRFFSQNDLIACFDYDKCEYQNLSDGFSTVIRKMTERQKGTKNLEHPHKKPIYLAEQIISHFSKTGDICLDLYLGSGTTIAASHQLGRKCYGMELDPKYCQVIIDRMHKLDPSLTIKINGVYYEAQKEE